MQFYEKVEHSEWASTIYIVMKKNGKMKITGNYKLISYDPAFPLLLATDANKVGLGAVLSHRLSNGEEPLIAYASRTLNNTKYPQIDKEALAIVWAVCKFFYYLYARHFTLITNHKPLTHFLFGKITFSIVLAANCLLFKHRVVVPPSLRLLIFNDARSPPVKMKGMGCSFVYWSDIENATSFTLGEFQTFLQMSGVKYHKRTTANHSSTNGQAERYIQTTKDKLKRITTTLGTLRQDLNEFLLFLRNLRTHLDLDRLQDVHEKIREKQQAKFKSPSCMQKIYFLSENPWMGKWIQGTIMVCLGGLYYEIDYQVKRFKQHLDQIRAFHGTESSRSFIRFRFIASSGKSIRATTTDPVLRDRLSIPYCTSGTRKRTTITASSLIKSSNSPFDAAGTSSTRAGQS
ncbi:POL3 protein, partial [Pseudoatta argentina]